MNVNFDPAARALAEVLALKLQMTRGTCAVELEFTDGHLRRARRRDLLPGGALGPPHPEELERQKASLLAALDARLPP